MKRVVCMAVALVLGTCTLSAQGKGKGRGHTTMPHRHESNAPASTPHGTTDRDFGRDRAAEVGKGKQKGLEKQTTPKTNRGKGRKPH